MVKGVTADLQTRRIALIHKRLATVQKNEPLTDRESFRAPPEPETQELSVIPCILEDCRRVMTSWGASGAFDPFDKVYEVCFVLGFRRELELIPLQLVFQLTVRSLSCSEISDDAALVSRLKRLYDKLDTGTTPATVLIPWFPTPAMLQKLWATKEIYDIVVRAINTREQSGVSRRDTLQMLLDSGDEKLIVVGVSGVRFRASTPMTGSHYSL